MNLGVIAARGGSKGLPGKNVRLLAGSPLIVYTIRAAQKSRLLEDFLVSTDDPMIAEAARSAGAPVPFLRPPPLATDDISIWPAVAHAVDQWEKTSGRIAKNVVLLQPTSPLRIAEDIDGCLSQFLKNKADICLSVVQAHDSPYFNLVEPDPAETGLVRACSAVMLSHWRRQEAKPVYAVNGAVYVVGRTLLPTLDNQFRLQRITAYEMPRERSLDIDTQEDLDLAEWWLSRSGEKLRSAGARKVQA